MGYATSKTHIYLRYKGVCYMLEHISKKQEHIWNVRFEQKLKDNNLSQRKFIELYRKKFGHGSQADVSKWMHVGQKDGRTKKERGFPSFETMRNIAEILEVSVGYLIGETDCDTFDLEKASNYIGLSATSIMCIKNILDRNFKSIPDYNFNWRFSQLGQSLECVLQNPLFIDYLYGIGELANTIQRSEKLPNLYESVLEIIPERYRDDVEALHIDSEKAVNNGIDPTEILWAFEKFLDKAEYESIYQPDEAEQNINSAKYVLNTKHNALIESLVSPENIAKLYFPIYNEDDDKNK